MAKKLFCTSQEYAKGDCKKAYICGPDDPEAQIFCCAHLHEARAFPCPYNLSEIYEESMRLRIAHKDEKGNLVGRCVDFEPVETSNQR